LRYDLLFQWFLDLALEEEPFDASTFSKNQQRLLEHQVADEFLAEAVGVLKERGLLSEEHFSVDGTLIDAWASLKSFRPKDEEVYCSPKFGSPALCVERLARACWILWVVQYIRALLAVQNHAKCGRAQNSDRSLR
jgi:hypothetical protein